MNTGKLTTSLAIIALLLTGCKPTDKPVPAGATKVGVYDSRAIAYAYWSQQIDGKRRFDHPDYHTASAAWEYWNQLIDGKPRYTPPEDDALKGKEFGYMLHQQVFSYHEPTQALQYIADKLPDVMEQAGVDVIVCKWEKEKLAKYEPAQLIDITDTLVQLYDPTPDFLKDAIKGFAESTPEPLDTNWLTAEE